MTWPIKTPDDIRREMAEREASWRGITAEEVRAKLRAIDGHPFRALCGGFLATGLRMYAPHHLGLLPPAFLAEDTPPPRTGVVIALPRRPAPLVRHDA